MRKEAKAPPICIHLILGSHPHFGGGAGVGCGGGCDVQSHVQAPIPQAHVRPATHGPGLALAVLNELPSPLSLDLGLPMVSPNPNLISTSPHWAPRSPQTAIFHLRLSGEFIPIPVQSQQCKHIFRADIFSLWKSQALQQTLPIGINEGNGYLFCSLTFCAE